MLPRNFILCYRGADTYSFVHRTFLEYFCAEEIRHRFDKRGTEGGLTFEQLQEVFAQHWQDDTWHEVLQLICGMIDINFSSKVINYLIEIDVNNLGLFGFSNLFLASSCFSEIRNQNLVKPLSDKLLENLKDLFKNSKPQNGCIPLRHK
jgi:predicted NACHT family NTPase